MRTLFFCTFNGIGNTPCSDISRCCPIGGTEKEEAKKAEIPEIIESLFVQVLKNDSQYWIEVFEYAISSHKNSDKSNKVATKISIIASLLSSIVTQLTDQQLVINLKNFFNRFPQEKLRKPKYQKVGTLIGLLQNIDTAELERVNTILIKDKSSWHSIFSKDFDGSSQITRQLVMSALARKLLLIHRYFNEGV